MPYCETCKAYFDSKTYVDQHANKHASYKDNKISREEIVKNIEKKTEPSHIIGIEPIIKTNIPVHEEPQEKRKNNLVCKTLRNLHR